MNPLQSTSIVLASTSASRKAMLLSAGVIFSAEAPLVDELGLRESLESAGASPRDVADMLAETKAIKVSRRHPGTLVLGADQILVDAGGHILEKPETRENAAAQLRGLMGGEHRLISAAVIAENGEPVWRAIDSARLTMRSLSDAFIDAYLDVEAEHVIHCVGSYRIEALGAQLFTKVSGDHFTIRGLPLLAVLDYLRVRGILTS